jgi:hypothetical protein
MKSWQIFCISSGVMAARKRVKDALTSGKIDRPHNEHPTVPLKTLHSATWFADTWQPKIITISVRGKPYRRFGESVNERDDYAG